MPPRVPPPSWVEPLSQQLSHACADLDTDEGHIFRDDVVRAYPQFKDSYEKLCPQRTDLTSMAAKARSHGYAKTASGAYVALPDIAINAFIADCKLMHDNCIKFNGATSVFAAVAKLFLARAVATAKSLQAQFAVGQSTPVLASKPTSQETDMSVEELPARTSTRSQAAAIAAPAVPAAVPPTRRTLPAAVVAGSNSAVAVATTSGRKTPTAPPLLAQPQNAADPAATRTHPPAAPRPAPKPEAEPPLRRPPRTEEHPVPLRIPPQLKLYLLEAHIRECDEGSVTVGGTALPLPCQPLRQLRSSSVNQPPWAAVASSFLPLDEEVAFRLQRYPAKVTAASVLRDFTEAVKAVTAETAGAAGNIGRGAVAEAMFPGFVSEVTEDFADHCAAVVDRVIVPVFNRTVYSCGLYADERTDFMLLLGKGKLAAVAGDTAVIEYGAIRTHVRDACQLFGADVLLRVLVYLPSVAAAVLANHLDGTAAADGAVQRTVVPVVEALLRFLDAQRRVYGLTLRATADDDGEDDEALKAED
jgi:hypothetical protein